MKVKSLIEKLTTTLSEHFKIVNVSEIESKFLTDNQIAIMSKHYSVVIEKKSDDKKDDKEEPQNSKPVAPVKAAFTKILFEDGKKVTIKGVVKSVDGNSVTVVNKSGAMELYFPIEGLAVGDKIEIVIRKNNE